MRSVLVCVRSLMAARTIAACAARLGAAGLVRTAASEVELLARLADRRADVVLVDGAAARPDPAAFTRRVLARSPGATVVLLGIEDPRAAAAAVSAGARGVLRGTGQDLITTVTKALLLCLPVAAPAAAAGQPAAGGGAAGPAPVDGAPAAGPAADTPAGAQPEAAAIGDDGAAPVGTVASDGPAEPPSRPGLAAPVPTRAGLNSGPAAVVPQQRADAPRNQGGGRWVPLTERELQVLRGMAEGKSNAEIGRELYVSEDTVKTHARRLFRKLGARDRAHAVAAGFRAGLVT